MNVWDQKQGDLHESTASSSFEMKPGDVVFIKKGAEPVPCL